MPRALLGGEARVGFCALRPPGHHAEPERAMGFCLFNNVAIAAALAVARARASSACSILDWDVHHGNGTAEVFRRRADVLFASIHQAGIYPGTGALADTGSGEGEGYTINLPVPAGRDEDIWLSLLEHVVLPAARRVRAASSCWSPPASTPTATTRSPSCRLEARPSPRWPATSATRRAARARRSGPCSRAATTHRPGRLGGRDAGRARRRGRGDLGGAGAAADLAGRLRRRPLLGSLTDS